MMPTPRKDIRLPRDDYVGKRIYFLTICSEKRRPIFLQSEYAGAVVEELRKVADRLKVLVHAYCVMPDHVHLLIEGRTAETDVVRFVAQWKQGTGFRLREVLSRRFWQRGFYDHILRRAADSEAVAWYIWMNPVRKGLAAAPEKYPFSGSLTVEWPRNVVPARSWEPPWKQESPL